MVVPRKINILRIIQFLTIPLCVCVLKSTMKQWSFVVNGRNRGSLFNSFVISNKNLDTIENGNKTSVTIRHNIRPRAADAAFHEILTRRASINQTIVLASVDSGYLDMAINLYLTFMKKFAIDNYLFVGSDPDVCVALSAVNITCYVYLHDPDASIPSPYSSTAFKRKTHLKTKIVLEALRLDLSVLLTDLDIVFFKNPLLTFTCQSCDLEISSDVTEVNSGFYFVRATRVALKLHNNAWNYGLARPDVSNQNAIGLYLKRMKSRNEIKVNYLDPKIYVNGKNYFDDAGRMFKGDNRCPECVMVHNNWIYSSAAKIYRFKEFGFWHYDKNAYFSNSTNKFLSFGLPRQYHGKSTRKAEIDALKHALVLGSMLDRIVILPRFHCYECGCFSTCKEKPTECSLGSILNMEVLDSKLRGRYRESVFLTHEKVPNVIKQSVSGYFIISRHRDDVLANHSREIHRFYAKDEAGATSEEILAWFGHRPEAVLRFHSIYDLPLHNENAEATKHILKQIKNGFRAFECRKS